MTNFRSLRKTSKTMHEFACFRVPMAQSCPIFETSSTSGYGFVTDESSGELPQQHPLIVCCAASRMHIEAVPCPIDAHHLDTAFFTACKNAVCCYSILSSNVSIGFSGDVAAIHRQKPKSGRRTSLKHSADIRTE